MNDWNLIQLMGAVHHVVRTLGDEETLADALERSLRAAADGLGLEHASVSLVDAAAPLQMRALHFVGRARKAGDILPHAVKSGEFSLSASALCAPIRDPLGTSVVAALYVQRDPKSRREWSQPEREWLRQYADLLGHALAPCVARSRREAVSAVFPVPHGVAELVGVSSWSIAFRREMHTVHVPSINAPCPDPVLIVGERGTGKDLVARYLHGCSERRRRPLVVLNCAEVTDELASSRLFGHKKGSFTGAVQDELGVFRAAHGGVLFLDEVADLSLRAQACLLRVLENRTVVPVGETREVSVEVAVVLATNRDLHECVAAGTLRADFHDRVQIQQIALRPLRERPVDIPALSDHFRRHHEERLGKTTSGFSAKLTRTMVAYPWPGNVRELARTCGVLVSHAEPCGRVDVELARRVRPELFSATPNPVAAPFFGRDSSFNDATRDFQRELILARLEECGGDSQAARESLGMTKSTFHRYLRAFGIARDASKRRDDARSALRTPAGVEEAR